MIKPNNILIIGSGAMGSAIANVLFDNKTNNYPINEIVIYGIDNQELKNLSNGNNERYFPKVSLHKFTTTNNLEMALQNKNYIVLAVPSQIIKKMLDQIKPYLTSKTIIINLAKGLDLEDEKPIHNLIVENVSNIQGVVSLIGPSHAEEIVTRQLTVINAVSLNYDLNQEIIDLFANNYLLIKNEKDVIGANIGAFYKNIIAIASGMMDSLNCSINTKAAFLTYGLQEMVTFAELMGGQSSTIYGLNGIGDLLVTANSKLSRNYNFGLTYQEKNTNNKKNTIEGINACKVVYNLARTQNLKLPIVNILYKILFCNQKLDITIWQKVFI